MFANYTSNGTESPYAVNNSQAASFLPGKLRVLGEADATTSAPISATKWINWFTSIASSNDTNATSSYEGPFIVSTLASEAKSDSFGNRSIPAHPMILPGLEYEDPWVGTRVFCGIILCVIAVIGTFGNIGVLWSSSKQLTVNSLQILKKTTNRIILFLACIDLVGCLVNAPLTLVVMVFKINGRPLDILSALIISLTQITGCGYFACLLLLAMTRKDAIIRFARANRITEKRLRRLILLVVLLSSLLGFATFSAAFKGHLVLWGPSLSYSYTTVANAISSAVAVFGIMSAVYAIKSYCDIKRYMKIHNKSTSLKLEARKQRVRVAKVTQLIRQLTAVFLVSYCPWTAVRTTYYILRRHLIFIPFTTDLMMVARLFLFIYHAVNPIMHGGFGTRVSRALGLCHPCFGQTKGRKSENADCGNAFEMGRMRLPSKNMFLPAFLRKNHPDLEREKKNPPHSVVRAEIHCDPRNSQVQQQAENPRVDEKEETRNKSYRNDTKETLHRKSSCFVVEVEINPIHSDKRMARVLPLQRKSILRKEARSRHEREAPTAHDPVATNLHSVVFAWPDLTHEQHTEDWEQHTPESQDGKAVSTRKRGIYCA